MTAAVTMNAPATTNKIALSEYPLVEGQFVARPNRFIAEVSVEINGLKENVKAHVPNTGRMQELLVPGAAVRMAYAPSSKRKTDYTLLSVRYKGIWVCVYAVMANALAYTYLQSFPNIKDLKREVRYKNSRFDLAFSQDGEKCLYEVKSANLVVDGCAMFPDAPTERGAKHLEELMEALDDHYRTGVFFVIQREDAVFFMPNKKTDPRFAALLKRCQIKGVEIRALRCRVDETEIIIEEEIPVILD